MGVFMAISYGVSLVNGALFNQVNILSSVVLTGAFSVTKQKKL